MVPVTPATPLPPKPMAPPTKLPLAVADTRTLSRTVIRAPRSIPARVAIRITPTCAPPPIAAVPAPLIAPTTPIM